MARHTRTLTSWDNKFSFGKYFGDTLTYVFSTDLTYIIWCYENVATHNNPVTEDIYQEAKQKQWKLYEELLNESA